MAWWLLGMSVSRCLTPQLHQTCKKTSKFRIWGHGFALGSDTAVCSMPQKSRAMRGAVWSHAFFNFSKSSDCFFLCEFLFQKKRTSDCFCVDMPSIRFGLGSSSFGCGAAVGFPDPSFRGERPPDRISRWVWASLGDLGDTWKLWICQVLLSPFVVSRPRRTHWKSSIREIRITWRDTQLLVVPGTSRDTQTVTYM